MLTKPALITSISTNVANAHEIPPAWLPDMDVYCDYRKTTPASAGEMKLAAQLHDWSPESVLGDLPELVVRHRQKTLRATTRVFPLNWTRDWKTSRSPTNYSDT